MASTGAHCDNCGEHFANRFQLGPHRRACFRAQAPAQFDSDCTSDDSQFTDDSDCTSVISHPHDSASAATCEMPVNILALGRRQLYQGEETDAGFIRTATYDPRYTCDYRQVMQTV